MRMDSQTPRRTRSYCAAQVHSTKRATPRPTNKLSDVDTTTEATPAVLTEDVDADPLSVVVPVVEEPEPVVPEPPLFPALVVPEVGATFAVAAEASFLNSARERVALAAVLNIHVSHFHIVNDVIGLWLTSR